MKSVVDSVLQSEQGQDENTETRAEVVQLFRSRATQLLHYFVLLLHSAVAQLWAVVGAGGRPDIAQAVLEVSDNFLCTLHVDHWTQIKYTSQNKNLIVRIWSFIKSVLVAGVLW